MFISILFSTTNPFSFTPARILKGANVVAQPTETLFETPISHCRVLIQVPPAFFLVLVFADVPGKQQMMMQVLEFPPSTWEGWMEFRLLALAWSSPSSGSYLGQGCGGGYQQMTDRQMSHLWHSS